MQNTVIREYYLFLALKQAGICMISATYVTFLRGKGLNLLEVNLVNTVFFVTLFLCEIPTGAFADVFGRKKSYVTSCALYALSLYLYALSDTFIEFVLCEMLSAIAATFATGALDAWFVDRLRHYGNERPLKMIITRGALIAQISGMCTGILGAYLATYSTSAPWIAGGSVFVIMGVIAVCTTKEEYFVPKKLSFSAGWSECKETVKASVNYSKRNMNVRFVVVIMILFNFATMAPNMQWQPFYEMWFTDPVSMGWVHAGIKASLIVGSLLILFALKRWGDEEKILLTLLCLVGIGIALAGVSSDVSLSLLMFFGHEIARGAITPVKDAYLHDHIPSKERATIVSFESIGHHFGGAVGLVLSGVAALYIPLGGVWVLSGGCLVLAALVLLRRR